MQSNFVNLSNENITKHIGVLKNTNKKIAIVFHILPGTRDKALVCDLESLPPRLADNMTEIIYSSDAQQPGFFDLYNILARRLSSDGGVPLINELHMRNYLFAVPHDLVLVTPRPNIIIPLNQLIDELIKNGTIKLENNNFNNNLNNNTNNTNDTNNNFNDKNTNTNNNILENFENKSLNNVLTDDNDYDDNDYDDKDYNENDYDDKNYNENNNLNYDFKNTFKNLENEFSLFNNKTEDIKQYIQNIPENKTEIKVKNNIFETETYAKDDSTNSMSYLKSKKNPKLSKVYIENARFHLIKLTKNLELALYHNPSLEIFIREHFNNIATNVIEKVKLYDNDYIVKREKVISSNEFTVKKRRGRKRKNSII